ncbi:MAG: pentapeptide repeat-containing protein [Planctomycetota bacterium]
MLRTSRTHPDGDRRSAFGIPLRLVVSLALAAPTSVSAQTCGSCPSVGFCPPTFPFGVGPFEQHGCENHAGIAAAFADLNFADLSSADLSSADLSFAGLSGAGFSGADLSGADLSGGFLIFADFRLADLSGADLSSADLVSADFSGASLTGAAGLASAAGSAFYDCATDFTGTLFDPVAAGWVNLTACGVCVPASEVLRNSTAAPNPEAFRPGQTSGPVLGATWDPVVDHSSFLPAAVLDVAAFSPNPTDVALGALGQLLCAGPYFNVTVVPAGAPFAFVLPEDCTLPGTIACVGAGSVDASGGVALTNAIDIVIGTY